MLLSPLVVSEVLYLVDDLTLIFGTRPARYTAASFEFRLSQMNGPINSAATGGFTSSLKAISDVGKTPGISDSELQHVEFSDLIDQQNAVPGLLEALKGILPEQDFSQIEALVNSGNSLPPAADSGSELALMLGQSPFPIEATLAVARQQFAAAQLAGEALTPVVNSALTESGLPSGLREGSAFLANTVTAVGPEASKLNVNGSNQAVNGFAMQLLHTDLESMARTRRSALQESTAAAAINPLSAMRAAETTTPMRLSFPTPMTLDTPLAGKGWEQGLGDRLIWMLGHSVQGVSLRINPAHLGPVDIQLSMHQDQATVTFTAQHAAVREALEASIPRLREMFQEHNLQLANVDVGQRGNSGRETAGDGAHSGRDQLSGEMMDQSGYDNTGAEGQVALQRVSDGLLNDYA